MRWERIKIGGLGPFKAVDIDLAAIDGTLIAVTGDNGAGKSTLLELLAGALYRQCRTRGTLTSLAKGRDAYVEVHAVNGHAFTIRQTVDGIGGKGESLVLDSDGRAVLESTKVTHFDAWAKDHLLPPEVLYCSSFAAQKSAGFVGLSKGDRKAVLLRILGIERYERMAERARERARGAKATADQIRARLADEQARTPDAQVARAELDEATKQVTARFEAAAAARAALDRARAAAADAERARELVEQRQAIELRVQQGEAQLRELEERLNNNRKLQGRAQEIRAAVKRSTTLTEELDALRRQAADLSSKLAGRAEKARAALSTANRADQAEKECAERVRRVELRLRDKAKIEDAVAQIAVLRTREGELVEALAQVEARDTALQELLLTGKDSRIKGLRTTLEQIADGAIPAGEECNTAAETILADNQALKAQLDAPQELAQVRSDIQRRRAELQQLRTQITGMEQLAARHPEMLAAAADLVAAQHDHAAAVERRSIATNESEAAADAEGQLRSEAAAVEQQAQTRQQEVAELSALVRHAGPLEVAEARIEELTRQSADVRATLDRARLELAALPNVEAGDLDVTPYESAAAEAAQDENRAREAAALAAKTVEDADAGAQRIAQLQTELERADIDTADWTRIAQDVGRDGLQAMEIDAAIPELNTIANDLLHECHGPRFTVELRTERLSSDGKKTIEGLDVRVIDTKEGRDALVETFSGGEEVIVSEAIGLALTALACRCAGLERPTVVRDESGAALDPTNCPAWIAMLRRAAKHINAAQVLFVSHNPIATDLADARIVIGSDGNVEVHA